MYKNKSKAVLVFVLTAIMCLSGFAVLGSIPTASALTPQSTTTPTYAVEFQEFGLSSGVPWTVTLNGVTQVVSTNTTTFSEQNGTYSYTISTGAGYTPSVSTGSVTVNGVKILQNVTFAIPTYAVSFTISLPFPAELIFAGQNSTPGAVNPSFEMANGTWNYHVSWQGVTGYKPISGVVYVNGAAVSKTLTLVVIPAVPTYSITFAESGLPVASYFNVSIYTSTANVMGPVQVSAKNAATVAGSLANGTYTYYAWTNITGDYSIAEYGSFSVSGNSKVLPSMAFTTGGYAVSFSESGLGVNAPYFGISFDSMTKWGGSGAALVFNVPSGTYSFSVLSIPEYTFTPSSGSIVVGAATAETITYKASPVYTVTFTESGLASGTAWYVNIEGLYNKSTTSTVTMAGPDFAFINGTYSYSVGVSPGYIATPSAGSFTVKGLTVAISISFSSAVFNANFVPSGLYGWATFDAVLNGYTQSAKDSTISFLQVNGTFAYNISLVPEYFTLSTAKTGHVDVNGSAVTQTIKFLAENFTLNFTETNLPQFSNWTVTINGIPHSSVTPSILVSLPDGSYVYFITAPAGFLATPDSGSVVVSNASIFTHISFSPVNTATYTITFFETGLPQGASWSVTLGGTTQSSTTNTVAFTEPNGTYVYVITAPAGYLVTPSSGALVVSGKSMIQDLSFALPNTYTVTFTESGLALGTTWSVTLDGQIQSSTTNTIAFSGINGTYSYEVNNVSGYLVGNGQLNGIGHNGQTLTVTFVPHTPASIWSAYGWYIIGAAAVIIIVLAAFAGGKKDESKKGRYK